MVIKGVNLEEETVGGLKKRVKDGGYLLLAAVVSSPRGEGREGRSNV
jgi:hypothetical protein